MPDMAYYNGKFCKLDELRVSPEDRAFYFGDGVYEVVKVLGGRFFAADLHLDRLYRSAAGIELGLPWTRGEIMAVLERLVQDSGYRDALVYFQVSRGVAPRKHYYPPAGTMPSFCAWVKSYTGLPQEVYDQGVKLVTAPDLRWPQAWIKSISLLPNCMAADAAHRAGAYEAALVDRADGLVNECSAANLFAVVDGVVRTAPKNRNILWGVSRHVTIQCARAAGIPVEERAFSVPEMMAADEVFLTSTSPDVLGVAEIDGRPIGHGRPGPITRKLLELFRHHIRTGEYRQA